MVIKGKGDYGSIFICGPSFEGAYSILSTNCGISNKAREFNRSHYFDIHRGLSKLLLVILNLKKWQ